MTEKYFPLAVIKDAPSPTEITKIHSLLTINTGFFIDRELILLLTRPEVSHILGVPMQRGNVNDATLVDLIRREEIREWSNLPEIYNLKKTTRKGISLLSVFEYVIKRDGGIVESPGKFPLDTYQIGIQKEALRRILAQVSDWQTRVVASYEAA